MSCAGAQPPRVRQFCVNIAPPYDLRNIDAALLREHSVRRICAFYKVLQICANFTHASTHALNLRKNAAKKLAHTPKKNQEFFYPSRIRTRAVCFLSRRSDHSATPPAPATSYENGLYKQNWLVACAKLRKTLVIFLQTRRMRKIAQKTPVKIFL